PQHTDRVTWISKTYQQRFSSYRGIERRCWFVVLAGGRWVARHLSSRHSAFRFWRDDRSPDRGPLSLCWICHSDHRRSERESSRAPRLSAKCFWTLGVCSDRGDATRCGRNYIFTVDRIRRRAVADTRPGVAGCAHDWLGKAVDYSSGVAGAAIDRSDLELCGNGARVSLRLQRRNPNANHYDPGNGNDPWTAECIWIRHL